MPPSALLAMVGPRVANHVLHTLHDAFPDRFPLSPTLENFANGEMDVVLTGDDRRRRWTRSTRRSSTRSPTSAGTCSTRASSPRRREIDACLILGAGFPFFRGGLTPYLDESGVSERVTGRPLRESAARSG